MEYGTTTSYGSSTTVDSALVSIHQQALSGLVPSTAYHYRVRSTNSTGQESVSADNTFTTSGSGGAATVNVSTLATVGTVVSAWGPIERNRSNGEQGAADGGTLRIGGVSYATGIGTHANSDVTFSLPAGCTTFQAQIGMDAEVGTNGSAGFEVWNGTTTRLYQSPTKTGGQAATAISVPITGLTTLRLVTTAGGDNSWDHTDWADAKLLCGASTTPIASISSPADHQAFTIGQTVNFAGVGTEADGTPVPAASMVWQIDVLHCPFGGACHDHPLATRTGPSPTLVVPDHADDSHLEVTLTVTGASGETASVTRAIDYRTIPLTLTSSPPGLQLLYGGTPVVTPFTTNAVVGATRTIEAPATQPGGATFASWSDGGTAQHDITVGTSATTLTATYAGGTSSTVNVSSLATVGTPVNGWGPFERDRSNGETGATDGGPIRIAGTTYATGIGAHAASDITFSVPAGCTAFQAQVGVDGEVGVNGSVVFEVWNGTTTRLYQSPTKIGGQAATAINVPITGLAELRLVVTGAGNGIGWDHADWADARITCG